MLRQRQGTNTSCNMQNMLKTISQRCPTSPLVGRNSTVAGALAARVDRALRKNVAGWPLYDIVNQRYHRCMAMNDAGFDEVATQAYAHLFQAVSEPKRLAILQHLASGEHRVRDLVDHLDLAQSTVSKHLSFLTECRLIAARPQGRSTWYALAEPMLLKELIAVAEKMLEATGKSAQLCDHLRLGEEVVVGEK